MSKSTVTLIISKLTGVLNNVSGIDCRFPALETILAKSHQSISCEKKESHLIRTLLDSSNHNHSDAIFSYLYDGGTLDEIKNTHILRADPVLLYPDRDRLLLFDNDQLNISKAEAESLVNEFNHYFADENIQLLFFKPNRWYLKKKIPCDTKFSDIEDVSGHHVESFMPSGSQSNYWKKLLNETQILFFNSKVNQQRDLEGHQKINSIWVWEGPENTLTESPPKTSHFNYCFSQNPVTLGRSLASNCQTNENLESTSWDQQFNIKGQYLIQIESLKLALKNQSFEEWLQQLTLLEKNFFQPLLNAVHRGAIDSLKIHLMNGKYLKFSKYSLLKFWKINKPLS